MEAKGSFSQDVDLIPAQQSVVRAPRYGLHCRAMFVSVCIYASARCQSQSNELGPDSILV